GSNKAGDVAPLTIEALRAAKETGKPWFMSVGFFETHRDFAAPTSVRDTLYSLPPGNLPDQPETRRDMAEFKASVRSLDQGIGAVDRPDWLQGKSLLPLLRRVVNVLHEATFAEMTYHVAYEPQRSVRTERWKYIRRFDDYPGPVLVNCDDSAAKSIWLEADW